MIDLGDDAMEDVDEHKVKGGRALDVEADFEQVVVVGRDAEAGQEAVDHEVHLLVVAVLHPRIQLGRVEEQRLRRKHTPS